MVYQLEAIRTPPWAEPIQKTPKVPVPQWLRDRPPAEPAETAEPPAASRKWGNIYSHKSKEEQSADPGLLKAMNLETPWNNTLDPSGAENNTAAHRMARLRKKAVSILEGNPFLPFTVRGLAVAFNVAGLGIACVIYVATHNYRGPTYVLGQRPSTIMAIVVMTVAIVYLSYTTYDEYFGQPLGLRRANSKMKFIMFDLVLISFGSANLALAFNALFDRDWVCTFDHTSVLCKRQHVLVGLIFVSLVLWVITFAISLYRMISRASS